MTWSPSLVLVSLARPIRSIAGHTEIYVWPARLTYTLPSTDRFQYLHGEVLAPYLYCTIDNIADCTASDRCWGRVHGLCTRLASFLGG